MQASQAFRSGDVRAPERPGQRLSLTAAVAADSALAFMQDAPPSRVLHVFREVCNLTDSKGNILTLCLDPRQMTSFSIALEHPWWLDDLLHYLDADSPLAIAPGRIELGPLEIVVASPARWSSRPDWPSIRSRISHSKHRLDEIGAILRSQTDPESLAAVHSALTCRQDQCAGHWWETALEAVQALLRGLRSLDPDQLRLGASRLAGLGPGLTPSGDDFLIGSMHAIWSYKKPGEAHALCSHISEAATPRTNVFSAAHLRAAARGEAAAQWQNLLTLLSEPALHGLVPATKALLAQGHTSGQDALSGFLLGTGQLASQTP
jgi:hypothetical protein